MSSLFAFQHDLVLVNDQVKALPPHDVDNFIRVNGKLVVLSSVMIQILCRPIVAVVSDLSSDFRVLYMCTF